MIKLKNVKKKYRKQILFSKINLQIDRCGIYGIVGENGSGKTTLLNIVSGFIKPTKGRVTNKFKDVSFISQKVNLLDNLTVKEHFEMFNLDVNLLRKFNLISSVNKYPSELSFGMQQRVAVLISLYKSSLIICDEPTSHLDDYNALLIMKEIKKVSKEKIVLLVSHDKKLVDKYCDGIYKIEDKKLNLIKENDEGKVIKSLKSKSKLKLRKYKKKGLFFYKINICYMSVFLALIFFLNLTISMKSNFGEYIQNGEIESLDYNKFYLKECSEISEGNLVVKKCSNLEKDKIDLLNGNDNFVGLNYDVFLNDLYEEDYFNVINKENIKLKEGRYPLKYNEVIATDNYFLGEEIAVEANKIINHNKIDIYKDKIIFKVVGIAYDKPLVNEDKIYVDYNLIEDYFKGRRLINNGVSLYDYFYDVELDTYKYVLYFKTINLSILEDNKIEYLSSSYDYYKSLHESFEEIIKCLNYLNVFMMFFSFIYGVRLIKKKIKFKEKDLLFFKSCGVNKKKIIKIFHKENKRLITLVSILSFVMVNLIGIMIFENFNVNLLAFLITYLVVLCLDKKLLKREISRKITI